MEGINVRTIEPADDVALAKIIRDTLAEFGANHAGTVYYDETTDHLYDLFRTEKSIYYVATLNGKIIGGAGIFPSPGLDSNTCELVKMYLLPEARGKGVGKYLIESCCEFAKKTGFKYVYLESMPELKKAVSLYERLGFKSLNHPLGNTGHFGCAIWMLKDVES
ncbi:MAG: GNAT family N-acetyltransferase [Bacteroidetes bacterium]|nr:MAG: GNAT family N-acetyltransferase [Bacteroidota bacterium]